MAMNSDEQIALQQINTNTPTSDQNYIGQTKNLNIFLAALICNLLSLSFGLSFGSFTVFYANFTSYIRIIKASDMNYMNIALTIAAIVSSVFAAFLAIKIGRKKVLLLSANSLFLSFLLCAFATTKLALYISRIIQGSGVGVGFTILPMYLSEISFNEYRGLITASMVLFIQIGITISSLISAFVSVKIFSLLCIIPIVAFSISFFLWNPESPIFLASRGQHQELKHNLRKLTEAVEKEIQNIDEYLEAGGNGNGIKDLFKKSLFLVLFLFVCQIVAGGETLAAYLEFPLYHFDTQRDLKFIMNFVTYSVRILSIVLALCTIDKLGRKFLLLTSAIASTILLIIIGIYFYFYYKGYYHLSFWILHILRNSLLFFNYLGLSTVPWVILGELINYPQKPAASAICFTLHFGFNLLFLYLCYLFILELGPNVVTWIFAILNIISVPFVFFLIPETKRKSFQEIQQILNRN